ncbi:MAG: MFS transporter, partial [Microbacteriaceae bacterium]|nr:MFS transporter [Microbacteriaceae bacterium]
MVWWILMVAAGGILTAMTFPGQTAGLSPFTDPLLAQLDIDRTAISLSYLIATLTGALTMPVLGRVMDKYGTKRAIIWIGVSLSLVLLGASFMSEIFGLTLSYVGLRMTGQGALSLAATTLIARTVTHRPGLALGIVGAIGSAGISLAPV